MMPKIKHQQRFMRQAIWLTALVGTSVLCVQTASAEPQVILNPRAYTLSQPGEAPVTIPAVETIGSAAQFYDYYSASSHTGYERLGRSLMFLHRDVSQNPPPVSLIITHGIDYDTSGQRQPTAEVNMDITNLPAATVITQSDDGGELKKVNATTAEGRWWFRDNTDGGVIQGLPEDQDWDINIDVDFIQGLTEYEYFFANGQNITLDPTKSVTIGYDAPPTNATYSVEGYEGVPVTICATVVSNNNSTSSYVWTWETDAAPHTSTGSTGSDIETICNTYTYQEDGIYEVELEVTDGTGTSTVTTRVFINNTDPPGDNVDPLHDEFDGEWKSCLWDSYQRYGGDTYREGDPKYDPGLNTVRNDRLDLKVPANYLAGMDWETGLESTYMLGGNFDVQVDFHLPDAEYWTNLDMRGLNVLFVELMANDAGSRRRQVRNSRLNPDTNQAVFNPHLWVANASASKVTQIDTDNPTTNYGSVDNGILGQYNTGNNPSRTSVDLLGNVWINHRCDSSVWRIRASECTPPSCTVTEVNTGYKDEFNTAYSNGQCNGGGVAVDKNNDPWVGFLNDRVITKLDQSTGQVVLATSVPGRVYGVAVDVNDYIWVDQMWDSRISKVDALTGAKIADYRPNDGLCFSPYGIAVDAYGKIWNGMWGSCPYITRFDPVTETFERFQSPNGSADLHYNRGVAADNQGLVWTVSSYRDKLSVFNMDTGAFVASYNTCDSPSGVALDRNNRVWVTCMGGNGAVWMHDRDGTPLAQIQTGSTTYSYSDMTGYQLRNFGSDAWKESFTASQSVQEDAYFVSSVENNYGGGIEDGVGGNESVDPTLAPVQNLSTTSANQYELNRIRFGELYYTDKLFRILGQPSDVEGLWGLRTPDNDRLRKDDVLVTLDANQELDAYIAYDAKANRLPSWLQNNYTMVDDDNDGNQDQVTTTNTRSPVYDLYKRRYNTGDQIVFGGNLARTSATGTVYASCKDIIARDPLAPSGTYTIDNGTSGPISVFCDMESDGGVGHTAIRIPVPTTSTNQNDYAAACNAIGMDIIVPRSKGHAEQLMAHFGEAPNVVNVKAVNVDGSTVDPYSRYSSFGFSGWIGHCRDEAGSPRDCSYYLSDYNDGDCDKASPNELNPFFPYVDGSHDKLLTRSTATNAPGCRMGEWYSNRQMYITGWVMCSPNDTYIEPAQSCADIAFAKSQHNTTQGISGTYTLTTQSGTTYEAYCDMHLEGGGWTQGIRQANNSTLFNYDSSYWTDGTLYNEGQVAPNNRDAKFQSFLSVPFDEIAVGMTQSYGATAESTISRDSYRYVTMPQSASSMLSLFQSPGEKLSNATLAGTSTTGRNAWKSLITDSSLQYNCNKQGANVGNNYARVRLGILGNNENDCGSPDSRLGVGGRGSACGQDNNNTSGNTATCSPDNGDRNHRAASTVMARKKYGKLIADWDFNGDLTDRSGNGHDARVRVTNRPWCTQAGPVYNTGVSAATQDQALEYDGCDDLIDVPSMATVNTDSVTLSMWLYLDSSKFARDANNNWISLLNKTFETYGATTGYDIVIEENGLVAFDTSHQGISGSHRWWTRKKVPFDEWAHLAVSYDNVTKTKYAWINGELIDTVNLPANYGGIKPNGVVLYIGSNPNTYPANGGGTIPGKLDNLKVYDGLIPQEAMESLAGSRASSRVSNYFAYFKPTIFSQAPPAISQYTIIEDPVKDAQDNDKDVLSTAGRLRITRTASIWSFFYADEVTDPTVWKRMGDPMDLGEQNTRIRVRTRLDPFWHSGPVNNPGGALSIQYDNYRVNSADEVIGAPIEVCNGLDDDCDGRIDENYVGKYEPCNTGLPGVCGDGYLVCENGGMVCKQINQPSVELCDNIDNDCNGIVDDFVDGGETASGDYVSTGESCSDDGATGPCQNGQYICEMGVMVCKGVTPAEPEICDGIDNDCDGVVDNTSNHIFAELTQFLTAKQRTMPFIWPRPVIGTMPFFTDNGDPNDDFVRYDGVNSDPALSTVYLTTTSSVHTLRKAKVIFYLDPTLADAQNPRGRYVLWLTHGRAEAAQGAANAAYAIKHTFDNPLDVIFNDSNESSIHAGNSSNSYQNFVVTSETASSGGVALGSLPSAENWTIELSATFDGDIDGWELYNPETGAHLELNPSQKLTLENQDLPGSTLLTADSGQPCAVPGAQGICEMGTGVCFDGNFICNQTVTPMPHELCDGLDNDCDGLADEASNIVYAKVEIRQDGHPDLDSWLWAPTIDNGISPEQSMNFQPEVSDDRVGSPDMRSVEDMMQSLQKLDASVLTFHLDQRKGQGTISMPLLHGAREENVTALVPAETRLELELERMSGGTLPKELFTSLYDDRTGAVADAAPSDYDPNKFTFNWTLERNSTSAVNVMREADGIVVRDIAESYSFAGSSYQLKFKEMGNLDAWEFYRPYRVVITLDEDKPVEVRTSLVTESDALCVIQDHPLEKCLGTLSNYVCVDGQVTCQINPAGCCEDLDGDGYYGYDSVTCATGTDCDDDNELVNPAAQEICDGIDNDCNGFINGTQECSWLDSSCNVIDEEFPEAGDACEGPLDADCNEVGDGGYDCTRDAAGKCILDAEGKCDLFVVTSVGECSTSTVCLDGNLTCNNTGGPTEEVCDGLDNDCDGEVDASYYSKDNTPDAPEYCLDGKRCGPRECDYQDVCGCEPGKIGVEACECRAALEFSQGTNPCTGNTYFDGTQCVAVCTEDSDCEDGFVCDMTTRACVKPAPKASQDATSPGGCSSAKAPATPTGGFLLGSLLLLGGLCSSRRRRKK